MNLHSRSCLASLFLVFLACPSASAAPYQRTVALNCSGRLCSGETPVIPSGRKLDVQTVSCVMYMSGNNPAVAIWGKVIVGNFSQNIRLDRISGNGFVSGVAAMPTRVASGLKLQFVGVLDDGGALINGGCSVRGQLTAN